MDGSPTEMIAHYVTSVLLPMADLVIDLHSGGRSLVYLPCCLIRAGGTEAEARKLIELMRILGAPIGLISEGAGRGGALTLSDAAQALGGPALTRSWRRRNLLTRGRGHRKPGLHRLLNYIGISPNAETEPPPSA